MSEISAQVSVYPLRTPSLTPAIDAALAEFGRHGLDIRPGPISTLVVGDQNEVFAGLQDAFARCCEQGDAVMIVSFSNACPMCGH